LRTWVGKVPLSSDYKDDILKNGNVSAELKSRFDKIKPSKERTTEVAGWSKIKSAADLAAEKEKEKEAKEAATKSSSASSVDSAKQLATQKAEQAKTEAAKLAAQKTATPVVTATAAANDDDEKPALTAQTLLARQFYVSDQLKKVYANVRYPKKALEREQSGSVRLTIVINRQGNLISASIAQASEFEILNEAALEAVNKTTFTAIPDAITGATFEFNAPLRFTLQQK
jgi:periplasmic protein TonB